MPSLPELARPECYAWSLLAMHRFFFAWEAPLFDALACADDRLTLADDTDEGQRAAMLHGARACFGALRGFLGSIPAPYGAHEMARRHG